MKTQGLLATFALAAAIALTALPEAAFAAVATPAIGDKTTDGTVYAGISPDTGLPLHTTAAPAPGVFNWDKGRAYCAALEEEGHNDWRVPTKGELNVLFANRAAIGGFNETGSFPAGWYWSSSPGNYTSAWAQRFSDGFQYHLHWGYGSSLRCVR
jgi:hypothetical protein